jgi:hypothetical protein
MLYQDSAQTVKFSPHFRRLFSEWLRHGAADPVLPIPFGILLGATLGKTCIIQSFHDFSHFKTASNWDTAFENWCRNSAIEPEMTWLDVLGWFCVRPESTGEIQPSDVHFHNAHFAATAALAVIFHSPSHDKIAAELYSGVPGSPLDISKHRCVWVDIETSGSDVTFNAGAKLGDQRFLQAYQLGFALDDAERRAERKEPRGRFWTLKWLTRQ